MYLTTRIYSLSIGDQYSVAGDGSEARRLTINFALEAEGIERLKLETGEIFCSPHYAETLSNRNRFISMGLTLLSDEGKSLASHNAMRYREGSGGDEPKDSLIDASYFLSPAAMDELLTNIRSALLPIAVTISFAWNVKDDNAPLKYGSAPSGLELIWRNKGKSGRLVPIESVAFAYDPILIAEDEDGVRLGAPLSKSVSSLESRSSASTDEHLKGMRYLLGLILIILIGISFHLTWGFG